MAVEKNRSSKFNNMNGKGRGYKELKVYQMAYELVLEIFTISEYFLVAKKSSAFTANCYCHCYLTLLHKSRSMK